MEELIKKAIEQLERISKIIGSVGETEDFTHVAIEALEKQIPLKPFEVLGIYDNTEYECKYCGDEIPKKGKFYNHCPHCGQAIDWKE